MRYSVTGTRDLGSGGEIVEEAIRKLRKVTEFSTGGAKGVDSYAAEMAVIHHPQALHRLCVPKFLAWNEGLVDKLEEEHGFTFDKTHYVRGTYMDRNDALISYADVLLAFPKTKNEELRSGTWATVRRARKKGIPILVYPINGDSQWKESD